MLKWMNSLKYLKDKYWDCKHHKNEEKRFTNANTVNGSNTMEKCNFVDIKKAVKSGRIEKKGLREMNFQKVLCKKD